MSAGALILGACLLGVGTFLIRAAGPFLHSRMDVDQRLLRLMSLAATVLLVALLATSAVFDGTEISDPARPAGVAVAGVLALKRFPFVVVVVAAAATTACLRLFL